MYNFSASKIHSRTRPRRRRFFEAEKIFRSPLTSTSLDPENDNNAKAKTGYPSSSPTLSPSSSSPLIADDGNPFDLKEFLKSLDAPKIRDPDEIVEDGQRALKKHESKMKLMEQKIRNELNKTSKLFFCSQPNASNKNESKLHGSDLAKNQASVFGVASHNQVKVLDPKPSTSSNVHKTPSLIKMGESRAAQRPNREFNSNSCNDQVQKAKTTEDQGVFGSHAISITNPASISTPRPKDRRLLKSVPAEEVEFDNLYALSGSLVYRMNFTEPNTFAKPRDFFISSGKHFFVEVEMRGFKDDEIFFQTNDTALIVIGVRKARDGFSARKITEVVELPDGIYPETLRISRTKIGNLLVEQANH